MNTRDYKNFSSGGFYHIFNRGTGKMNIFCDREDYILFLNRLFENIYPPPRPPPTKYGYIRRTLPPESFDILCYCLMPNHFHILLRQNTEIPISKLVSKVCTSYAKYFNKKYDRVGTLFQDQFKAVLVTSNDQLLWLSSYIHKNPLKAGLVSNLYDYKYSSYLDYVGRSRDALCKKNIVLEQCGSSVETYNRDVMGNSRDNSINVTVFEDTQRRYSSST